MSTYEKIGDWIAIIVASGLGFLAWWTAQSHGLSENMARAAAYTTGIFFLLAMALRPAWRRLRFWVDMLGLLVLHTVLILPLVNLLDTHRIRLNWALALPFVMVELLLALGALWRRNVT
jgi:hypothetical protein